MAPVYSSRILELNIISAQDLARVSKSLKTYAVAWVDPERKLTTGVDQTNHTNPIWNEKFVFRVGEKFLCNEDSAVVIEIYSAAWVKDALIGTVHVYLNDLFSGCDKQNSSMKLVSLQICRPSGRPQGTLRMGVALLDSSLRSMPLSTVTIEEHPQPHQKPRQPHQTPMIQLRRSHSDRTDFTTSENYYYTEKAESLIMGSSQPRSNIKGPESMLNGSLCNSDIGPSASVVAAAIAKGLYYKQMVPAHAKDVGGGSSILEDTMEGFKEKLERWRMETALGNQSKYRKGESSDVSNKSRRRRKSMGDADGKGLCSCFGNVFGVEISITCGGDKKKNGKKEKSKRGTGKSKLISNVSSDQYSESYI